VAEKGHGRIEKRETRVYVVDEPLETGLFQASTLLVTERTRHEIKTGKTSSQTVFHLCTAACGSRDAAGWAEAVRAHWAVENANHWRRDACLFEDKTPGRNSFVVGNLAVSRAALLFFNASAGSGNINRCAQDAHRDPSRLFHWLTATGELK
jgi:predicted transposase YbfD/YdcC